MERPAGNHKTHEHRIDIPSGGNAPSLALSNANGIQSNTGDSSSICLCCCNCFCDCIINCIECIADSWTTVKRLFTFSRIVASIVVLVMARHENPQAPLFAWVVGYAVGCATNLAVLYKNHVHNLMLYTLLNKYLKNALYLFFLIWFVLGNIWVYGYHSSHQAPKLFRLCIVFLSFSYIWYAMIIILATLFTIEGGVSNAWNQYRALKGATSQCIDAMPTYKFKLQRNASHNSVEINPQVNEGGVVAAGTEKERVISADDAVCCICLARYGDNDKLKELPCSHLFHSKCIDKWLKKMAMCPLCKRKTPSAKG